MSLQPQTNLFYIFKLMKRTLIVMLAAALFTANMQAQKAKENTKEQSTQQESVDRSKKMAVRLADALKLDDKTQDWFVPIYAEYQDSLRSLRRLARPVNEIGQKADLNTLTDAQAVALVESTLMVDEKETALKRACYEQLRQRLTPQQLVSIFCRQPRLQLSPNGGFKGKAVKGGQGIRLRQGGDFPQRMDRQ